MKHPVRKTLALFIIGMMLLSPYGMPSQAGSSSSKNTLTSVTSGITWKKLCSGCSGSGKEVDVHSHKRVTCSRLNGSKKMTCSTCDGTGRIPCKSCGGK